MPDAKTQPSFFELLGKAPIGEALKAAEDQMGLGVKVDYFADGARHYLDENGQVFQDHGDSDQVRMLRKRFFSEPELVQMPTASHTSGSVTLSPFDMQYFSAGSIPLAWFYKHNVDDDKLKEALSLTLAKYPLLAGRFSKDGKAFDLNNAGCSYQVQYDSQLQMRNLMWNIRQGIIREPASCMAVGDQTYFLPINYQKQLKFDTELPLLTVKVTRFERGLGTCIGICVPHTVLDTEGVVNFVCDWSRVYNNLYGNVTHDYDRLGYLASVAQAPSVASGNDFEELTASKASGAKTLLETMRKQWFGDSQLVTAIFPISKAGKEKIKAAASVGLPEGKFVSTNDAVSAFVWRALSVAKCEEKGLNPNAVFTTAAVQLNFRKRVPALAEMEAAYSGNCLSTVTTSMSAGSLETDLPAAALALRDTLQGFTAESIFSRAKWLKERQDEGKQITPSLDDKGLKFYISAWQFDIGGADFGGKPFHFDHGFASAMTAVLAYTLSGGVDVSVSGSPKSVESILAKLKEALPA